MTVEEFLVEAVRAAEAEGDKTLRDKLLTLKVESNPYADNAFYLHNANEAGFAIVEDNRITIVVRPKRPLWARRLYREPIV